MDSKISIIRYIRKYGIGLIFLASILILIFNIFSLNKNYTYNVHSIRSNYINSQKDIIKREVEKTLETIEFEKKISRERTKSYIKENLLQAHNIASSIYRQSKGKLSDNQIKKNIINTLRNLRYSDSTGYFFIADYNGIEILNAHNPSLENNNLHDLQDYDGKYVVRDLIKICKEDGEGFYEYKWPKPGYKGSNYKKIAYTKSFEPYPWLIGTGLYEYDIEVDVKKQLLDYLNDLSYGNSGYIFAATWNGISLTKPARNINMINVEDVNGVKIVQNLIKISKDSCGFFEYSMPGISKDKFRKKISFVKGLPDWQWYIGSGVYIDSIEKEIAIIKKKLEEQIIYNILTILIFTSLLSIIFLLLLKHLENVLKQDINRFTSSLKLIANDNLPIDRDLIEFDELDKLTITANAILKEKHVIQSALMDEKEKLYTTINSINDGIITTDRCGIIDMVNPIASQLLESTSDQIINRQIDDIYILETGNSSPIDDIITRKQSSVTKEEVLISPSGKKYDVLEFSSPLHSIDGKLIGAILVFRDITLDKKNQEKLKQTEKMEAIGQLAGGVAHDFNNMLTGILSASELIRVSAGKDNDKVIKYSHSIVKSCKKASELTAKLLAFGRKTTTKNVVVHIHEVLDDIVEISKRTFNKQIEISLQKSAILDIVNGDTTVIQNMFLNISINASHAINESGIIMIKTRNIQLDSSYCLESLFNISAGCFIEITISDTGCGISPENLDKIFEPFFTTKVQGKGTGLGLSSVYGAIQEHNGEIKAESLQGEGTTFTILLPCGTGSTIEKSIQNTNVDYKRGKVLLVDDDEVIIETTKDNLESFGYEVLIAKNGADALQIYNQIGDSIDIVVSDMIMPIMNGKDLFYQLKQVNNEIKFILISGFTNSQNIDMMYKDGLSDLLAKPYNIEKLVELISKILRSKTK